MRHFKVPGSKAPLAEHHAFGEKHVRKLVARVDHLPASALYAIAVSLILLIAVADVRSGPELSLFILYLLPISMLAWHRGWRVARMAAMGCTLVWLAAKGIAGESYSRPFFLYWNATVRAGTFFIVGYTLSRLRVAVDEQQRLARTDSLTGVANGRSFLDIARLEILRQRRYGHPLSMAYLDCDNFKEVNDRAGHAAGDELLCTIASILHERVRAVDTVARLGGDEFVVLLPESDVAAADVVCAKIRESLRTTLTSFRVTCSIGLVTYMSPPSDAEELIHMADETMYEAKKAGKNVARHRVVGEHVKSGTDE